MNIIARILLFYIETTTANDIIFVGTARLMKRRTISELSLMESNKNEYFTRHLVDGRIIYCDHRISVVSGYMSEEVSGTSAFKFMHKDDVRWTIIALRHSKKHESLQILLIIETFYTFFSFQCTMREKVMDLPVIDS